MDDGHVISDPGHALEYAGLLFKLGAVLRGPSAGALADIISAMPAYLARNFANGFQPATGGICKTVDLLTRQPVDDTLPWWSLPDADPGYHTALSLIDALRAIDSIGTLT